MMRILAGGLALIVLAAAAFAGWYFRPWSEFSPAQINALSDEANFPDVFQRMDAVLPSRPVAAGAPDPLPRAEPLALPETVPGPQGPIDVAAYLEAADVLGLVILSDGAVVHETYRMGAGPETRFTSWSVAKSVVATLVAMALKDGAIASLDDEAQLYAPQFAGTDYGATSLRHLLMMSAGVDFNEDYSEGGRSDIRPLFFNAFILGRDVDAMVAEVVRDRPAGADLHYVSPNTHVLAAAARGALGGDLAALVERRLWTPLGMEADATWLTNTPRADAQAIGYCCLQARGVDYARFGWFYLQDGVWEGERLLPEGWVEQASRPNAPFQEPGPDAPYAPRGYGLHFWIPPDADGEFFAAGVYGQYIWIDRRRGVVIAQNAGDPDWGAKAEEAFAVFRGLAAHAAAARAPEGEAAP